MNTVFNAFYEKWKESQGYEQQSALENREFDNCSEKILETIGKQAHYDIMDVIIDLASEAERAGFENGLKYGVMFMRDIINDTETI